MMLSIKRFNIYQSTKLTLRLQKSNYTTNYKCLMFYVATLLKFCVINIPVITNSHHFLFTIFYDV